MLSSVRRVVTGQTAEGEHLFTHVEAVEPLEMGGGAKWYGVWGWDTMPTLPHCALGPYQPRSVFPTAGGMRINTVSFPPGFGVKGAKMPAVKPAEIYQKLMSAEPSGGEHDFDVGMHSTDSIDFGFVSSGEITLIQGNGAEVTLCPGDVMIQNGALHAWENRGAEPCVINFVVLGTPRVAAQNPKD